MRKLPHPNFLPEGERGSSALPLSPGGEREAVGISSHRRQRVGGYTGRRSRRASPPPAGERAGSRRLFERANDLIARIGYRSRPGRPDIHYLSASTGKPLERGHP